MAAPKSLNDDIITFGWTEDGRVRLTSTPRGGEGEVVVVEEHEREGAEELFALIDQSRGFLRKWLGWVDAAKTKQSSIDFIDSIHKEYPRRGNNPKPFAGGIFVSSTSSPPSTPTSSSFRLVGCIGFNDVDPHSQIAVLGYWLGGEKETGKGRVTRALELMVAYSFGEGGLGLNRVVVKCGSGNRGSRRVAERVGLVWEGTERDGEKLYGEFQDLEVFSMLKREWDEKEKEKEKRRGKE